MKLVVITGTRPNFVKEYAFSRACAKRGVEEVVVHTGQHYDRSMSETFFRELSLQSPDYVNDHIKSTPAREIADIMVFVEGVLSQEKPDATVVYGDVTSTVAAALASARLRIPVVHVEAGARAPEGHRYNPEEVNRRVTEILADTLLAHIQEARDALLASGFPEKNVFLTGDIMKDSLLMAMRDHNIPIDNKGYVLASVHRAENADDAGHMRNICQALLECSREVYFPVHPRTKNALVHYGLWDELQKAKHINLLGPQGYLDNVRLLAGADRVASDSGGLRREAFILGKPVIALTDIVWVPSMVESGWEYVAGWDRDAILHGLEQFMPPAERPEIFGDGKAAERMVDILIERYGSGKTKADGAACGLDLTETALAWYKDQAPLPMRVASRRETISIVTPCYNEEDSLPIYFHRADQLRQIIDRNRFKLEFVLVNDNSSDATRAMLEQKYRGNSSVVIVNNPDNLGLGGALKEGFKKANGDIVVTIDADTNYDILDTPKLLDFMIDDVDIVTGSPFMKGGEWNYPAHRFFLSQGLVFLYRAALGKHAREIKTFTCGFRAYRREALGTITPQANDFLATAEMLVRGLVGGLNVAECPVVNYDRKFGKSKLRTLRTMRSHLQFLWTIWKNRLGDAAGGTRPDAR